MKEQFLNLTGLTELVGYLKTSIADHKEILPYASNKLFPSVGDINTIYIDTATNTIYRWDESNEKYIILAQAIKSVNIESTENGKLTLIVDGNKTTIPIHGLGSAAYTDASNYALANHFHTKDEVGLKNVDNTADVDKDVKHAISADTVPWSGVLNTPTSYPPSVHTHDDSTITSLDASKLFGTIDIERLPQGSLERCIIVENDEARFALTTDNIQLGDTVKVKNTEKMYFVIDESKLDSEEGYTVYAAGTAASVPWSGITGKPTSYPPSEHAHDYLSLSGGTVTGQIIAPVLNATSHFVTPSMIGEGDNSTYYHRIDFGRSGNNKFDFYEYGGIYNFYKNTSAGKDSAILIGKITSDGWVGDVIGNATSATKLQYSCKIGQASFDGTADITLSEMGINNPIEITRAEFDKLSEAGEIDDNAYYNILDDYDAALIINDSLLSVNQTFSSNKIDEVFSKKSIKTTIRLSKDKWVGTSSPYKYIASVSGVTDSNTVEISCATGASTEVIDTYCNSGFQDGGQNENQIIITAKRKPSVDIPIVVMVRNDL